jgi:exoribonuclease R
VSGLERYFLSSFLPAYSIGGRDLTDFDTTLKATDSRSGIHIAAVALCLNHR